MSLGIGVTAGFARLVAALNVLASRPAGYGEPSPTWHGICAWTDDPALVTNSTKPTAGELRIGYARADAARTSGATLNLHLEVTVAGAGLTYARAALYRLNAGVWEQIALSADQATAWTSLGVKSMPVTLTGPIAAGDQLYFALLSTGTTIATFRQATTSALINLGGFKRRASQTGQAALPATLNLASFTAQQGMTWMALS